MPFPIYFGWGLLIPACLSLLYGFPAHRAMTVLGCPQKDSVWARLRISLPSMLLFTVWGMVNIPLPVVYVLAFLGKLTHLPRVKTDCPKAIFIFNLAHLVSIALHMILIGICSLVMGSQMNELLQHPYWRILTAGIVLAANDLIAWRLPRWAALTKVLRTQSQSEEIRPFMAFLWFCNFFLLMDSVLCIATIGWKLLPVFLIGSTVLMEFYLIRFLWHLLTLLKVRYLEEEHRDLMEELEQRNQNAVKLRNKSEIDALTGIFSRRYAMERAAFLLQSKEPFSLAFIDLDHLKQINDRDGHHAGDRYLIRFAKGFAACLRRQDIFARVGGDEFAVLLPGCALEPAKNRIEDIRSRMEKEYSPPLSFSFGLSFVPENSGDSVEDIFRQADSAMYRDKQRRTV